jgi:hypothetical protein
MRKPTTPKTSKTKVKRTKILKTFDNPKLGTKLEYDNIIFKSFLERDCYVMLKAVGLEFKYEPKAFEIFPAHKFINPGRHRWGKKYLDSENKEFGSVHYTPDFVADDGSWIIETKGFPSPAFQIKAKLFRKILTEEHPGTSYYLPRNKKELKITIEEILNRIKLNS